MRQRLHFRDFWYIHLLWVLQVMIGQLTAGNSFAATTTPPRNPNSAKECAICHYRWIGTFFVQGRGTDLVPYQSEKVAATPEMCFSCHDGSVVDSRERVMHGKSHKTDVKPPAGMKIPEIFPLDDSGKVQCATCHTAHGVPSGPNVKETIFLRASNTDSAMCRMCHADKDGGVKAGNHSLGRSDHPIPQDLKMRGAYEGRQKNQVICETCHTAHGSPSEGYLVTSAGDSGLCLGCHGDKGMMTPSGERNANHVINVEPRKAVIPETLYQSGAKLGDAGRITCQTCHKIHNNHIQQAMLLIRENRQSDFCLECHPDKQRLEKTNHNLSISAKAEKNLEGKTVAESGICSACHLPHKAARRPYGKKEDKGRTTALCLSCHAKGGVAENKKLAGYSHPVGMTLSQTIQGADAVEYRAVVREKGVPALPLFNEFGVADKKGQMTCATCHDTHGGPSVPPAPAAEPGAPAAKNMLLRKPSPEICRTCHADKFAIENTRHDLAGVFPDGNRILKQAVPEPDLCRNCHWIHNREKEGYVWSQPMIPEAGGGVRDLCTRCHESTGLAPNMTVNQNSHPVNIGLGDRVRTSSLPLFNSSGNRTENGIMTCYTCHDPHRRSPVKSKNGEVVTVEGRPVNRFLRMENAPSSELCINCHEDKTDIRKTDHNLDISAPAATNADGRTAFESGVCGACHLMHHGTERIVLWARQLGASDQVMDRTCNSCHAEQGVAAEKVPPVSTHPDTIIIDKGSDNHDSKRVFPLFDKKTGAPVKAGNMSCPSCHDVHHWTRDAAAEQEGTRTAGNATTSFLRPLIHERVCKDCHGIDSLFQFKYFHKAGNRKKANHASQGSPIVQP